MEEGRKRGDDQDDPRKDAEDFLFRAYLGLGRSNGDRRPRDCPPCLPEQQDRRNREKREREDEQDVHRRAVGPAAADCKRRNGEICGNESEQYEPCVVAGERFAEDRGEPGEVGDRIDAKPRPRNCVADLAARLRPDDDARHVERVDDREEREVHEHCRLSTGVRVGSAPDKAHDDGQHRREEVERGPQALA